MEQITIDLVPIGVAANAHATQFDIGRGIRFNLKNGGTTYTLAGTETITIEMVKPDGSEQTISLTNTSSTYVDWTTADGELNQAGVYSAEISVKQGDDVLGSRNFFVKVEPDAFDGKNIRTITVGPADICTFEANLPEPYQSVLVDVEATGGNGTPDSPIPINGYTEANIVNTQNDSIVELFSVDSDFRGTVAFNQKVASYSNNSSTVVDNQDGTLTVTSNGTAYYFGVAVEAVGHAQLKTIIDHKYFFYSRVISSSIDNFKNFGVGNWQDGSQLSSQTSGEFAKIIRSKSNSVGTYFNVTTEGTSLNTDTFTCTKPILFDLTQMFGSTIADYIYTLESGTAGAGVAFFRNIYPEDYYAYDSGTTEIVGKETPEAVIAFGQTVYGGSLDVTRGKLTVTHDAVDLGSLSWNRTTSYTNPLFYTNLLTKKSGDITMLCDIYDFAGNFSNASTFSVSGDNTIGSCNANEQIYVRNDAYTDKDTFKAAMSGKYALYPLATSIEIDLTPVQIRALVGENNVFADCGQTTVEYLDEE